MSWIIVAGTRPEMTKLWSVAQAMPEVAIWLTGQHHDLLTATADSVRLRDFLARAEPLHVPTHPDPGVFAESVAQAVSSRLATQGAVRGVIVQGDTASAYGAAVGARRAGVRIAHVEAGVRTGDSSNPWPEETFRVAIDRMSRWRFAPTPHCLDNLGTEGLDGILTGNTGIDDLMADLPLPCAEPGPEVLLTLHRRESLSKLPEIADGLDWLAERRPAFRFVWPVHHNPVVRAAAEQVRFIHLVPPMGACEFRHALARSRLVVTDSGGVQEEAAHLGVPCLVARNVTDRPEAVAAGIAKVGGTDPVTLALAIRDELDAPSMLRRPYTGYGDGKSGSRIAATLRRAGHGMYPAMSQ